MNVLFVLTAPCVICGCHLRGVCSAGVRVNLGSLRTVGAYMGATARCCPECGDLATAECDRWLWTLEPESAAKVVEHRRRTRARRKVTAA